MDDKVGNNASILDMHARTIGIKDTYDFDLQSVLPMVVEKQCFSATLAFVIAGTKAQRVDIAPVGFWLRVNNWIAIYLRCGRLEDRGLQALG
ncbi:hypothetical protein A1351_20775 [Methylosinus sp. R-45379]|nr:hypothetical protein A1351_20775 [Methylosinus sp. R-45379]